MDDYRGAAAARLALVEPLIAYGVPAKILNPKGARYWCH